MFHELDACGCVNACGAVLTSDRAACSVDVRYTPDDRLHRLLLLLHPILEKQREAAPSCIAVLCSFEVLIQIAFKCKFL